jgi:CheY-like chemotaxis protein
MLKGLFNASKKYQRMTTILAVGDDHDDLRLLTNTLEISGYRVYAVDDVATAVSLLTEVEMPDLFIADFRNPEVDGTEFIRRLNVRYGKASLAPVIFLLDSVEDEQVAHAMGVKDIIAKPVNVEALLQCVKSAVAQS